MAEKKPNAAYEAKKIRETARSAAQSRSGRDIGELPAVANVRRRNAARKSFRRFCESYLKQTFSSPWSADHLKVIARIEEAVTNGGLFAMAMPRGSGKTSLCEAACLWALLSGRHEFVVLIGSDEDHAAKCLESIKVELEHNDLLAEDFPAACLPIRALEGVHQRRLLYKGEPIEMDLTKKHLALPWLVGAGAPTGVVAVAGITGRIRGMKHKLPDGRAIRPSLVFVDDPQTDESAASESQCRSREAVLNGAVLGLAGPGKKISGLAAVTVIQSGDLADRLLDRKKSPRWHGERMKMVYAFPTAEKLWVEYARIRDDSFRADGDGKEATGFYRANRAAMDACAVVAWPARKNPDELSAIQHAMNLKLDNEAAFFAEYQNEPRTVAIDATRLTPAAMAARVNARPRGEVPLSATCLTAFVDCHDSLLYWCAVAWAPGFTGSVVDYGTWPDQQKAWFTLKDATRTLARESPGAGIDGAMQAGLERLASWLAARAWPKGGGGEMRLDRLLIDAGYKPGIVASVARKIGGVAMASKGVGINAGRAPMSAYRRKPGERYGHHWMQPVTAGTRELPHVLIDTNYWKSFVHSRLSETPGDAGAMTLFGSDARDHELFAQHVAGSETYVATHGHGRDVQEWKPRPDRPDNHWFDCLVGCAAAASFAGMRTAGDTSGTGAKRVRVSFAEMQKRAREAKHG